MSLGSIEHHLEELRKALLFSLGCIAVSVAIACIYHQPIINCLSRLFPSEDTVMLRPVRFYNRTSAPIEYALSNATPLIHLSNGAKVKSPSVIDINPGAFIDLLEPMGPVLLSPAEGILSAFRVAFWTGIALSSPIWLLFILRFVAPGLQPQEKKQIVPFLVLGGLFFLLGLAFAYFISIPITNQTLFVFNAKLGMNLWSLGEYLNFILILLFATCLAFELAAILLFLVHIGLCSYPFLSQKRPYVVLCLFVVAAILTPPDIITQLLLVAPLWILYELATLYAWMRQSIGFCADWTK